MSMTVTFTQDPDAFASQCGDFLARHEVEHNLILSMLNSAQRQKKAGVTAPTEFMHVSDGDDIVMVAAMTEGRSLVLSREDLPAAEMLAEKLAERKNILPGVVGPSDVAASFVNRFTALTGQKAEEHIDQIIYATKRVLFPPQVPGELDHPQKKEEALIASWVEAFGNDALLRTEKMTHDQAVKKADSLIEAKNIAVWRVGKDAVAQAAFAGTKDVARINLVYTPPEERGKGYASAVVANLTQQLLDQGKKMCCLYADARNSVSNSIYRKIGYEFLGRSSHYILSNTTI